jgi:hypothetical protein
MMLLLLLECIPELILLAAAPILGGFSDKARLRYIYSRQIPYK